METVSFIHERLATTVLIYMLACALWGVVLYLRGEGVTGSYWGTLAIGEALIAAQALIGLIALIGGRVPLRTGVHVLYGVVALISLPAAFFYTRGRDNRSDVLIYGLVCAFLAGVAYRGMTTGGG